eukprot:scaffold17914_cov40-Attheya_sp.AAC.1
MICKQRNLTATKEVKIRYSNLDTTKRVELLWAEFTLLTTIRLPATCVTRVGESARYRTKELQNGSLDMLATADFMAQELTDGK